MRISSMFENGRQVLSFEVFPPKKTTPIEAIYSTLEALAGLKPDFISVTYGAAGSLSDNRTCRLASYIKSEYGIESIAHLTCINSTRSDIELVLNELRRNNIENILALRGDRNPEIEPKEEFKYASELVSFIKGFGGFHISGACYPEGHGEAASSERDLINLKHKVSCGAEHLVSQLFFDNAFFYSFEEKARRIGIDVPIEAGIMPVTNKNQIERMVTLCGASLPAKFVKIMQRYEHNPEALRDAGIAYAVDQIVDLLAQGVNGIHLYTMNNPYIAAKINQSITSLL